MVNLCVKLSFGHEKSLLVPTNLKLRTISEVELLLFLLLRFALVYLLLGIDGENMVLIH